MTVRTAGFLVGLIVGVVAALPPSASAQGVFRPYAPDKTGGFIEPPRSVRQQLNDAQEAIDEQRYSDAVLGLGKLLQRAGEASTDDVTGQDFFLDVGQDDLDGLAEQSLLRKAEDLLGGLPAEGLELYELNYGPAAKKAFAEAAGRRDWTQVKEVVRRYFHTEAGYQAAYLWSYHQLQTGRPIAAAMMLSRLSEQSRAVDQLGDPLRVSRALARKLSGQDAGSLSDQGVAQVRLAGALKDGPEAGDEVAWLERQFGTLKRIAPPPPTEYPVAGGDASRSLSEGGQRPLGRKRWDVEATAGAIESQQLREQTERFISQGELSPPTWMPLLVDDQVLMRTTDRLLGVDFKTGKRVWAYPWHTSTEEAGDAVRSEEDLEDDSMLLSQRVWFDLPYGRMSSDGERVFVIDDLAQIEPAQRYRPFGLRPVQQGIAERQNAGSNTLVALELKSQGKLLWRAGASEQQPTIFSDAFFLGPPLPIQGRLYVIAEISGDLSLLCLDPATGDLIWRQQLLAIETSSIENDAVRRVAGAMPAYKDGVLVCPTGAGALVAIDLASRNLLWGFQYRRSSDLDNAVSRRDRFDPVRLMQRWHDATPQIVGDTVYVTPIESDRLYALDLTTGEPRFSNIRRGEMRYLAGVRDDKILLVGTHEVQALSATNGRQVWSTYLNDRGQHAQVAGTGVFGGDLYFLPLTNRQIVAVDVNNGKLVQQQEMDYELGNLLQADGQLISQSPTSLAVSYGQQWLEPVVRQRLQENPDDLWAMMRQAELSMEKGERTVALEVLERARKLVPEEEELRDLSVKVMLEALRQDFDAHTDLLQPLERLVCFPDRRAELLSLMVRGKLQQDKPLEAFARLLDLSSLVIEEPDETASVRKLSPDSVRATPRLDDWIAAQMATVYQRANASQQAEIDEAIAGHLGKYLSNSTQSLMRLMRHSIAVPGAAEIRPEVMRRLVGEGEFLAAERLARTAIAFDSSQAGSDALRLALARVYVEAGFRRDAEPLLAGLGELADPGMQEQRETLQTQVETSAEVAWPEYVTTRWNVPEGARRSRRSPPDTLDVQARDSRQLDAWQAITEEGRTVSLRDPLGRIISIPMQSPPRSSEGARQVVFNGLVMVVLMPTEVVAVDMALATTGAPDSVLWQHPWRTELGGRMAKSDSVATPFGDYHKVYQISDSLRRAPGGEFRLGPVHGDTLYLFNAGELQALDLMTGSVRWRNSEAAMSGQIAISKTQLAVASTEETKPRIDLYDALDGRKRDTRPWPEGERLWLASGRHLLTYEVTKGNVPTAVRLRDPFRDEVVLERKIEAPEEGSTNVKGQIVEGRYLALIDAAGRVDVWDLQEGRVAGKHQLDAIEKLAGLHALRRGKSLILSAETSQKLARPANGLDPEVAHGPGVVRCDGPLVCVDLESGEVRWENELAEGPWGLTLDQAMGSPLLVFTRGQISYPPTQTTQRRKRLSLLAINVDDGKTMALQKELPLPSYNSDITAQLNVDPSQRVVAAVVGRSFMQLKFTEDPPEPQDDSDEGQQAPQEDREAPSLFDLFK